jgi:hypothetical protein
MMRHVRGRPPSGERLRELRELWQSQHANDIEVAAARRRFALGPRHYRLSFGLRALAGLSVVVLLSGVAVAGAGVSRWIESRAERARASAAAPPLASGRSEAARVRGPLPTLQPLPELPALSTSTPLAGSDPSGATGRGMPVRSDGSARPPAVREGLGGIIPEPLPAPNAPNAPNAASAATAVIARPARRARATTIPSRTRRSRSRPKRVRSLASHAPPSHDRRANRDRLSSHAPPSHDRPASRGQPPSHAPPSHDHRASRGQPPSHAPSQPTTIRWSSSMRARDGARERSRATTNDS